MKKLSQTFRIALALLIAAFSANVLPTVTAFAATAPGNNGTVKINDEVVNDDGGNQNEPQLNSCTVWVRWYGYDEGARTSTVTFESQSPTTAGQLVSPVGPQNANFTAPEPVTGNTLSSEKSYTLSFSGAPAAQGYHVKVTVTTDKSKGNDTKSKVFWLPSSCGPATVTPDFTLTGICGVNNDTVAIPTSNDYTASAPVWDNVNHKVSVTFTIKDGVNKVFSNYAKTITITKDELNTETVCTPPPSQIANPTINLQGVCGPHNDNVTVSTSADYTAGTPTWNAGVVSVTFTIKDGVNKVFSNGQKTITVTAQESDTSICPVTVTPAAPQFAEPTCEVTSGRIIIPATQGITYKINGVEKVAGTYTAAAGATVVVTATILPGYVLAGNAQSSWTHTFGTIGQCTLGDTDHCPNITGSQVTVPIGYSKDSLGNCVQPEAPQVLSTSTPVTPTTYSEELPAELPATGSVDLRGQLMIATAALLAYGATYFLQGRMKHFIARK